MPAAWLFGESFLENKRQKQVDVNFVNLLLLLPSYQTGYWRADKARMSSVSPEESPVFNCSSLLTTSRDQDSECVRLGPAEWGGRGRGGWEFVTGWRDKGLWEDWVDGVDIERQTWFGLRRHQDVRSYHYTTQLLGNVFCIVYYVMFSGPLFLPWWYEIVSGYHWLFSPVDLHCSLKSHWIRCSVSLGFVMKHAHVWCFLFCLSLQKRCELQWMLDWKKYISCILIQESLCCVCL